MITKESMEKKGEKMSLFGKKTIVEKRVHFALNTEAAKETEDYDLIDLEAHTSVDGVRTYLFASLHLKDLNMYGNGDFQAIQKLLGEAEDPTVNVKLIFKKEKLEDVQFDVEDLAKSFGDPRLLQLEHMISYVMDDSMEEQ